MDNNFRLILESRLSDFFKDHKFKIDFDSSIDSGNKTIAVYVSSILKLYFYRSRRDGEINCLIGRPDSNISNLSKGGWHYLNSLIFNHSGESIEQLLNQIPIVPESDDEQVRTIANNLEHHFNDIVRKFNLET